MKELIKALEALSPEDWKKVSECIKYDENVSELILSLRIQIALEGKGNEQ